MTIAPANVQAGGSAAVATQIEGHQLPADGGSVRLWKLVARRPLAIVCLGYLSVLVVTAIAAPLIAPYEPDAIDLDTVMSGPTGEHLLGTDPLGRDVLSRLIFGGQISLVNAAVAAVTFLLVGTSAGLVAGVIGGWVDRVFTWAVDVLIAIPALIVLLVILTIFGSNMTVAMLALGFLVAPGFARVVRGVALAIREELSIAAVRVIGLPSRYIVTHHVLPRVTGPILVHTSLFCGGALLIEAGLAYLGFGAGPPTPTWGGMITEASAVIQQHPWLLVPPGVTLALATIACALLGDTIRDVAAERTGRAPGRPKRQRESAAAAAVVHTSLRPVPESLLSMRGVSIAVSNSHGDINLVEKLDLDIMPREAVGLVGESGCGKSITGKATLGLLPAGAEVACGSIRVAGRELVGAPPAEIERLRGASIGMISQDPVASLDPMFTVKQQVGELVRRHKGGSRRDINARVLQLLADVALPDPEVVARRYPHELSGGMAQRVAIAMALAGEPELLIADEPTTALDVTVQAEILALLRNLQTTRHMAILLISHDWGIIAQNCRRAYVMYAGQIVESAPTAKMLGQPSHPYTIGLLRSMPQHSKPRQALAAISGTVPTPGQWPAGCHFTPRCPLAESECSQAAIPLIEYAPDRHSRCIRIDDLYRD